MGTVPIRGIVFQQHPALFVYAGPLVKAVTVWKFILQRDGSSWIHWQWALFVGGAPKQGMVCAGTGKGVWCHHIKRHYQCS